MFPSFTIITDARTPETKWTDAPIWEHDEITRRLECPTLYLGDSASTSMIMRRLARFGDPKKLRALATHLALFQAALAMSEASGWDCVLAARLGGWQGKLFIIFHGQHWWSRRNRVLARIARSMPNVHFLCLSEGLAALLRSAYGIPPHRLHVTSFGIDLEFFRPSSDSLPSRTNLIVSAGTASRDYRTLNEAVRDLGLATRIAADSDWHREPLNLDVSDVAPEVTVQGAGDLVGLRALYAQADLVVVPMMPVRYACGYAVIAQALAMGKPVIATRTDCPTDMLVDGVNGLYVSPGNVAELRLAIQRLASNPVQCRQLGKAARAQMELRHSTTAYVDRLIGAVEAVSRHIS